ncbi:hypothetical protein [Peribacillus sp. SCS-155]|uniref:hypothetical protein n=1 Tax=Peribacillus sedimenti TaxID=3115297 RepID=UPI003905CF07
MVKKIVQLMLGGTAGYLYIEWMPVSPSLSLYGFVVSLILDPVHFFAAAVAFVIAFINLASLIKDGIKKISAGLYTKRKDIIEVGICCLVLIIFFFLWKLGDLNTLLLFCFSIIYGIISVDLRQRP